MVRRIGFGDGQDEPDDAPASHPTPSARPADPDAGSTGDGGLSGGQTLDPPSGRPGQSLGTPGPRPAPPPGPDWDAGSDRRVLVLAGAAVFAVAGAVLGGALFLWGAASGSLAGLAGGIVLAVASLSWGLGTVVRGLLGLGPSRRRR